MKNTCPFIKPNEGTIDRIVRIIIGIIGLLIGFTILSGTAQIIAYVIGVIGLITGIVGYCGLYTILGINTKK